MNLKILNDSELEQSFLQSVKREREALSDVLHHIVEVERRKLYLKRSYPSLFEYLKKHLKYSNGTAQRRIDAARLMKDFPALTEKLESGDLNLGQVTLVQMALRQKTKESREGASCQNNSLAERNASHGSKESQVPVSREEKQALIESLMGKSEWESQQMLAQALDLRIQTRTKTQIQKDESVRLEVTLSKEQWKKLEQMRDLLSTSIPDGSWSEVLVHVAEKVIQQKTRVPKGRAFTNQDLSNQVPTNRVCANKIPTTNRIATTNRVPTKITVPCRESRATSSNKEQRKHSEVFTSKDTSSKEHLKPSTKRFILKRDACCQYQDPKTGKQCSSRWNLQIDHIHPLWDQGSHEVENLQVLCSAHNRYRYREQAGFR